VADPHPVPTPATTPPQPLSEPAGAPRRYWQKARVLAAQLVAEGQLTHAEICARVGKSGTWLVETKRNPWFRERVAALVDELAEEARQHGIANQRMRLEAQDARWQAMHRVIAERAAHPTLSAQPGGKTGLLAEDLRGKDAVPVYVVDTGLLGELRALEAQVAKELGQTAERPREGNGDTFIADKIMIVRNVPELGV
jgi:hypothetical protein